MAQIKATLSLVTSSVSSERFSFNASRLLTTQNPSIQTKTVDVATGSDTAIVTPAAGSAAYVFIFNQDNENFVKVFKSINALPTMFSIFYKLIY